MKWLNGRAWSGTTTLVGSDVCCIGCGKSHGVTCVAFSDGYVEPPIPEWPFREDDCPICKAEEPQLPPRIAEMYFELKQLRAGVSITTIEAIALWVAGDGTDAQRLALADGIRRGDWRAKEPK